MLSKKRGVFWSSLPSENFLILSLYAIILMPTDEGRGVKKKFLFLCFCMIGALSLFALQQNSEQDIQDFVVQIKESLESENLSAYAGLFDPLLQTQEKSFFPPVFESFQADSISVHVASVKAESETRAKVFLGVYFQNAHSVIFDIWKYTVARESNSWKIVDKKSGDHINKMYRLSIPSAKIERAKRVEIKHVDISLIFEKAVIFYDNIPELETALIIIGDGKVYFSPSHPREKHQLELIFKETHREEKIKYAFLRFSDSFFREGIEITKNPNADPITQSERNQAYSIFTKHYPRSFTVQSSLNNELLSALPQAEEAIFEFEAKKIGETAYIYSPFAREEINFYQWDEKRPLNLYSPPGEENKRRFFISFGQKFDITDCQVEIIFRPNDRYFSGKARVEIDSKIEFLDLLRIKLNPDFEILRIYDSQRRELYYTKDILRKNLYIYFLDAFKQGKTDFFEIFYRGRLTPEASVQDEFLSSLRQESRRFPDRWPESLLFTRSAHWYPASDGDDYFTSRLKITTPPGYYVVSNGNMVDRYEISNLSNVDDVTTMGNFVHIYESQKPIKNLSFFVGKLVEEGSVSAPFAMRYFRPSFLTLQRGNTLESAKDIFQFYQEKFGPFPFDTLSIIERVWPKEGGHSPPSFVVLNVPPSRGDPRLNPPISSPVDLSRWKEYFLAHEMAHQWWGQGVSWESYGDQWLSEGLAQFAASLYIGEKYGQKIYSQILDKFSSWVQKKSKWGPITLGARISYHDFAAYQTIVYNKSSLVLNMLKDLLGDQLFFSALKKFFEDYKYDSANTGKFINVIQDVSGKDWSLFFDKWLDSHLLPDTNVMYSIQKDSREIAIQFNIIQINEKFLFPLWVEWEENGHRVRKKIVVENRVVQKSFPVSAKPRRIKVNPDKAIPGRFRLSKSR